MLITINITIMMSSYIFRPMSFFSLMSCNLHFISSVGHKVNEEKNAAKNPKNRINGLLA